MSSAPPRPARAVSTVRTPAWNATSSVDATTLGSGRTDGASSAAIERDQGERPRRRDGRGRRRASPRPGSTWWASSMMSQWGRPVAERTVATVASTFVA